MTLRPHSYSTTEAALLVAAFEKAVEEARHKLATPANHEGDLAPVAPVCLERGCQHFHCECVARSHVAPREGFACGCADPSKCIICAPSSTQRSDVPLWQRLQNLGEFPFMDGWQDKLHECVSAAADMERELGALKAPSARATINQGEIMSLKHLLMDAKQEIESLRRRNEILQAKAEVVEAFSAALLGPRAQMGVSVDVVWSLHKEIEKLSAPEPFKPAEAANDAHSSGDNSDG